MSAESRTVKSIKNSLIALSFYFINLILQFLSRKIFLDYLGTEVLGLNATATNLLQFLNLAELGVSAAIAYTLYKPLHQKDQSTIDEIVSLQGWMYRRIAWFIIGGALVLMCFFPWIFAKMLLPMWYAYASFGVLLLSALLSYFTNYKQIILYTDQKDYKILCSYKAVTLLKVLCQLLAIKYFQHGYIWWLILEAGFSILASCALNYTIRKAYPNLHTDLSQGKYLRVKYPELIGKIKQLFFHKIAGFALTQTSPIIIYAYASLTLVALFSNYMLIITGVVSLMVAVFNSMNAGVGNLVAEGNKIQIMNVFEELFSIRFLITCSLCFGVYLLTPSFVSLWIGAQYIMDNQTLGLMVAIMYINLSRATVDAYLNAYGLFSDVWAPIVEACINIGLSVFLGYFFGLHGILTGVFISSLLIVFCWKPYFLFRKGLKIRVKIYVIMYAKHILVLLGSLIVMHPILRLINIDPMNGAVSWFLYSFLIIGIFFIILFIPLYIATKGMRMFTHHIQQLIKR